MTSYEVTWRPLDGANQSQEMKLPANLSRTSIILNSSDVGDYEIKVTAVNSAGPSPSSRITTVLLPNGEFPRDQRLDGGYVPCSYNLSYILRCSAAATLSPVRRESFISSTNWNYLFSEHIVLHSEMWVH